MGKEDAKNNNKVSRRTILKGALGTGLLISAGQALPGLTGDALGAVPKKWDRTYDVVVVGGGGAGLAAVVSAREAGAKAILIEKAPTFSASSTAISGGLFSAANSNAHKKAGVDYPAEKFYKDLLTWGDQTNIKELARTYADNSGTVIDWLVGLGMKILKIEPPRVYPDPPAGSTLVDLMARTIKARKIPVMMETRLTRLITNDAGRVVGIEAAGRGGKKMTIQAKKGVVLATGGFAGDFDLYDRILLDFRGGYSTCSPYATGDGMLAAQKIGADVTHLNLCAPYASGLEINKGKRFQPLTLTPMHYNKVGGIYVNKLGKRFCDDSAPLSWVGLEALPKQPDKIDFYIFDSVMAEKWQADKAIIFSTPIHEDVNKKEEKLTKSANSIEELANKIGVDPAALADTVAKFNSYVATKKDLEFGRKKLMDLKIEKPPYYALGPMKDNVVLVLGGLRANARGQVVDPFGKAIPGLYAAGELMGGVHGSKYYGGTAVGKAFTFGYLTGKNAAGGKA